MRLLSYNIHGCVGLDGREDSDRILQVIDAIDADIIALQEVDRRDLADRCLVEALSRRGTHQVIYGPTLRREQGAYGNFLLSRFPILSQRLLDLSVPGREPRGAICAVVAVAGLRVAIVATHLGLGMSERRQQVERLIAGFREERAEAIPDVHVLLGDFNEWFVPGRPLQRLRRYFGKSQARRTFPSQFPVFKLDRIWVKPAKRLRGLHVVDSPLARQASDHLPLVAELAL